MKNLIDDLIVFILTYNRPDHQYTLETLKNLDYSGKVLLVVDDGDPSLDKYLSKYGDMVYVFNKSEAKQLSHTDMGDNFDNKNAVVIARNYCFNIAKELGYKYFCELDDDYIYFSYRCNDNGVCRFTDKIPDFTGIMNSMLNFLENSNADGVAFAQTGDYLGGVGSSIFKDKIGRKLMNSFFFKTDNPQQFKGSQNEDVVLYVRGGMTGKLYMTPHEISLGQTETQHKSGGLTELYNKNTYVKTFYALMYAPSSIKISVFPGKHPRIHHKVMKNNTYVKILNEKYKKK